MALKRTEVHPRACRILPGLGLLGAALAGDGASGRVLGDGVALLQSSPTLASFDLERFDVERFDVERFDLEREGDEDFFEGADGLEHSWHTWYHLHTPRTAGTSFYRDAKWVFQNPPSGQEAAWSKNYRMLTKEGCYNWNDKIKHPPVEATAVFLRNPRAHVFSQFLFCSEGSIREMTKVRDLGEWLQQWIRLQREGKVAGTYTNDHGAHKDMIFQKYVTFTTLPDHCYCPVNMQTHRLTCDYPFEFPEEAPGPALAIRNMQNATFVGIVEAYQESICVFYSVVYNALPGFCDCRNQAAWKTFTGTHSAFHPLNTDRIRMLSNESAKAHEAMDALTREDAKVYRAALARFKVDVRGVEETFKTKLTCNEALFKGK